VVAGEESLDRLVRWVHAIELPDAARLLRGGELVLTTGIALPDEEERISNYVSELAGVGVSALAVELGRRYTGGLPACFAEAAEGAGLPLVVFGREVPFVAITEAVHGWIIDDQLEQLRASARLHEVFTDLAVAGAGPGEILRQGALLAGRPVILEDLAHRVLAYEAARRIRAAAEVRGAVADGRTGRADRLRRAVGVWSPRWGRGRTGGGSSRLRRPPPGPGDVVLVERMATTLALGRLLTRQHQSLNGRHTPH
jgi:purine catabolism regulator